LPGVDLIVVLTEMMGQQRIDIRTWAKGDDGYLRPTTTGFCLTLDQLLSFGRLIDEAERRAIEDREWVDLGKEVAT